MLFLIMDQTLQIGISYILIDFSIRHPDPLRRDRACKKIRIKNMMKNHNLNMLAPQRRSFAERILKELNSTSKMQAKNKQHDIPTINEMAVWPIDSAVVKIVS